MKRIFITGIAGFIGFHLAQRLHQSGHFVCGCDNFNDYYSPSLKRARAAQLGLNILEMDICDPAPLEQALIQHDITHFVHLAAQAGVRHSILHPEKYVHSNLIGFAEILEQCRKRPEMRLIYASSSSVYGLNQKIPFSEEDLTDQPANFYGATKKANELMAFSYHHLYGIPAIGLRFFTVYGPWGRPDMAYFSFTKNILTSTPITVYGEGKLERDFTYIDDIIDGILASLDCKNNFEIFNLGHHLPHSVLDLVSVIEKLTGKKALIQWQPKPLGDIALTYADISKSSQLLGFHPKTTLETGMERFIEWFQEHKK